MAIQPQQMNSYKNYMYIMCWKALYLVYLLCTCVRCSTLPEFGVGWGFAYEENNIYPWLEYLGNPQYVRVFIHTFIESSEPANNTADWRTFASNSWDQGRLDAYGSQFGVSFSGKPVDSNDLYKEAVDDLRSRARQKGETPMRTWIAQSHPAIDWDQLFWPLWKRAMGATLLQQGVPEEFIPRLRERQISVLAIFDLDCHELAFQTVDAADPNFFKERWEQYRLMYLGGLWMAEQGITDIELYNEPDKDTGCIDQPRYFDVMRINSEAFQDAAADLNRPKPTLIAPSTAASFSTTFGQSLFDYMHWPFGRDQEEGFTLFDEYAYHAYGDAVKCESEGKVTASCVPNGHGLRTKQDRVVDELSAVGYSNMPTHITEFNCFTYKGAEALKGHVFDMPETATCVGAQIGSLMVRNNIPTSMSLHKIAQNRVQTPSEVGKNGILFGQTTEAPFDVGGSTKAFEVYRLILNRATPAPSSIVTIPSPSHTFKYVADRVIAWGVKHTGDRMLSIFLSNQGATDEDVVIDMEALGASPGEVVTLNQVRRNLQGDMDFFQGRGNDPVGLPVVNRTMSIRITSSTFIEAVVPLVPTRLVAVNASKAYAVDPDRRYDDEGFDFAVTMDPKPRAFGMSADWSPLPRSILLRFDREALPDSSSIVRAVLRVWTTYNDTSHDDPQVLTVLGFKSSDIADWDNISWESAGIFKKNYGASTPRTIKDNIIDWTSNVKIVGHAVVQSTELISDQGMIPINLDVTRGIVDDGIDSFALVRMVRYDESGGGTLPQDEPKGFYTFAGSKVADHKFLGVVKPRLLINQQTNDPVPPFPAVPPPPPPFPAECKVDGGYYTLQGTTYFCRKKGLYLTHSLSSKNTLIYLKTKSRAPGSRKYWKPVVRQTGLYKGGFLTTIYAPGRRSKNSYLAKGTKPRLGRKDDCLMRIVPSKTCDRVQIISEERMRRGLPAFLRVDTLCSKVSWGRKADIKTYFYLRK